MKVVQFALAAAVTFAVVVSGVVGQEQRTALPEFRFLRQDEDWSAYRAAEGDWWSRFKHLDLSDDGATWLSVGGRVDARFEAWDGFDFGATMPGNKDSFLVSRALLHADLHVGDGARFFVEGKTAQVTDRSLPGRRRGVDLDTAEVQQAFADYKLDVGDGSTLRLRAGRQTFAKGSMRLVSSRRWGNALRAWDGIEARWRTGAWTVDAFFTHEVPIRKRRFNRVDDDLEFYGVFATRAPKAGERGYDVYLLGNTRENLTINGTTGNERRHTLGARTWGPLAMLGDAFDGELEAAYQFGEIGSNDINAWSVTGVLGHRPVGWRWSPRFFVGVDAASGDSTPGGSLGTFHQLYPMGHGYLGWADITGRQNIFAAQFGVALKLNDATTAHAVGHAFRLMNGQDALYGVGGGPTRTGFGSRDVGQEIDLRVAHQMCRHTKLYCGYSHVFGGGGLAAGGPSSDINFFYLGTSFVF